MDARIGSQIVQIVEVEINRLVEKGLKPSKVRLNIRDLASVKMHVNTLGHTLPKWPIGMKTITMSYCLGMMEFCEDENLIEGGAVLDTEEGMFSVFSLKEAT